MPANSSAHQLRICARMARWWWQAVSMLVLASFAFPALAVSTYAFTSPNYSFAIPFTAPCTIGTCANYTTSMHFAGSFTTASPLAANLVNAHVEAQVTSFSFSDGINTYTSSDANARLVNLQFSTDASGVPTPTSTFIQVQQWTTGTNPHTTSDRVNQSFIDFNADSFNNAGCSLVGTSNGVADVCKTVTNDSNRSEGDNSVAGTWTVSSTGGATPTTTTLGAAPNPTTAGQTVTLTATVSGSSPTGTVQFKDGATNLGSAVTLSGGIATLATSTLSVGTHSITALYSGDTNNAGSTSSAVNEVINAVPVGGAVAQPIPTLSEGALVLLALLIGAAAMAYRRNRMR